MKWMRYLLILVSLAACTPFEVHVPRGSVEAFVGAARVGDYATADQLSNDPDFIFSAWQARTETALRAGHLATYTIMMLLANSRRHEGCKA